MLRQQKKERALTKSANPHATPYLPSALVNQLCLNKHQDREFISKRENLLSNRLKQKSPKLNYFNICPRWAIEACTKEQHAHKKIHQPLST